MLPAFALAVVIALSACAAARADEGARYVATADEAACDRLAAHPLDEDTPEGVTGVDGIADENVAEAVRVCTAAVTAGSPLRRIAFEYGRALEFADRPSDAAIAYRKAADAGSTMGMVALAGLYIQGTGVGQDYAKARELLETAATRGNVIAMDNLGSIAGGALGDEPDLAKAREWFGKAAAAGFGELMLQLGLMDRDGDGASPMTPRRRPGSRRPRQRMWRRPTQASASSPRREEPDRRTRARQSASMRRAPSSATTMRRRPSIASNAPMRSRTRAAKPRAASVSGRTAWN